jgi:hypothetical protein
MDPARFAPEPPADPLDSPEVPGSGERMAVEIVASGTGHTVLPASVARMFGRKDVIALPLSGHPGWGVGLAWLKTADSELVQDFVGAAKGRRPGSSRNERGQSASGSASGAASRTSSGGRPVRKAPSRASAKSASKPRKRR